MQSSSSSFQLAGGQALQLGPCLAAGAEGSVHEVVGRPGKLAKIYADENEAAQDEHAAKLRVMVANQTLMDHPRLAWPEDLVLGAHGRVVGFIMKRLHGKSLVPLTALSEKEKQLPGWTQRHLCFVIFQIAKYCELLETHGVFPGDINYRNFLIDPATGVVGFIDCDSYQVSDHGTHYPCRVYMPEFQPPEVLREKGASLVIGPDQVLFSAAIMFFLVLTAGGHPYQVKQGGTQEENILAGRHFIGAKGCANGATTDEMYARYLALRPCPYLMSLFKRTFIEGHANPSRRPRWREWKEAIKIYDRILLAHAA